MVYNLCYSLWGKPFLCLCTVSLPSHPLIDFPRLEDWSEKASPSDTSLFMDGFLYIFSGPSKSTLDRRGRDGECECRLSKPLAIHQSICKQSTLHVCQRSTPVMGWSINQCQSVSCQTANPYSKQSSQNYQWICLSWFLWEYLSDRRKFLDYPAVNTLHKQRVN